MVAIQKSQRVDSLDGIRGITIGTILVHHLVIWPQYSGYLRILAMDIFFCLSGYVITLSIERSTPQDFFSRRFLRIVPIFVLTVVIVGIVLGWKGCVWPFFYMTNYFMWDKSGEFATHLCLTPSWSLSIEEHYYGVYPWIIWFVPEKWRNRLLIGLFLLPLIASLGWSFWGDGHDSELYTNELFKWPVFALGSWLALNKKPSRRAWIALFALGMITFDIAWMAPFKGGAHLCMITPWLAFLIIALAVKGKLNFLGWKPLVFVGKLSYGLYIYHYPIFEMVDSWSLPYGGSLVKVMLTFLVATVSWFFIETKMMSLGLVGSLNYGFYIFRYPIYEIVDSWSPYELRLLKCTVTSLVAVVSWFFTETKLVVLRMLLVLRNMKPW